MTIDTKLREEGMPLGGFEESSVEKNTSQVASSPVEEAIGRVSLPVQPGKIAVTQFLIVVLRW